MDISLTQLLTQGGPGGILLIFLVKEYFSWKKQQGQVCNTHVVERLDEQLEYLKEMDNKMDQHKEVMSQMLFYDKNFARTQEKMLEVLEGMQVNLLKSSGVLDRIIDRLDTINKN